jgi:ribosomal protein L27
MSRGIHEYETDEEAVVLTASESQFLVTHERARFARQRTSAFFGVAGASAALLLAVVGFIASSRAGLRPGLHNTSQVTVSKLGTSLVNEAEDLTKEKALRVPFNGQLLKAEFDEPSAHTLFMEIQMEDGTVSYRHGNGLFVTAKKGERTVSSPQVPGSTQFFGKKTNEDGTVSLMVHGGTWLTALPSGIIVADAANIQSWQSFTQEKGENGTVTLRSAHGKYLGSQTLGGQFVAAERSMLAKDFGRIITTAEADSIGPSEKFTLVYNMADETVSFKTKYGTFLRSPQTLEGLVSADSAEAGGRVAFILTNNNGKVCLHTFDGRYITALKNGFLIGDARQPNVWESFDMVSHGDGTVSLKSCHGKYVTATDASLLPEG